MLVLHQIVIVALIAAFTILFISRIGLRDFIIMRSPKPISELFSCDFCLCFWISVLISTILFLRQSPYDALFIFIPICSTPIARYLL